MRLILAFIEAMQVQPIITEYKLVLNNTKLHIKWKVYGCLTLNTMNILVHNSQSNNYDEYDMLNGKTGECNLGENQTEFEHYIKINDTQSSETNFTFRILADQDFFTQKDPDPKVPPQTHIVNLRSKHTVHINDNLTNKQKLYVIRIKDGTVSLADEGYETISDDF